MKKFIAFIAIIFAFAVIFIGLGAKIHKLEAERNKYKANTETLLQDIDRYRVKDSLNAVKVGELRLTLSEFQRYRANDAALIKSLKTQNKDLQAVTAVQLETISELQGAVRDSIIYLSGDTVTTVLRCVDIENSWIELHGCARPDGTFSGTCINRDSLLIAVTVKYKRFWGFLWKTRKVKNREVDIVSKNPYTKIIGADYFVIEKK